MYFRDIEDQDGFLVLVGQEIERRDGLEVALRDAVRAAADRALAAGDIFKNEDQVDQFAWDETYEIFAYATTQDIISAGYRHGTPDFMVLLDFGDGMTYLGFDRSEARDTEELVIAPVDPNDTEQLSRLAAEEMFIGVGSTIDYPPTEVDFAPQVQVEHVREYLVMSLGSGDIPALRIRPDTTPEERDRIIGRYLSEVLPSYGPDEATGMLLGDLLGLDDHILGADLDRVERELQAVKDELGERDSR